MKASDIKGKTVKSIEQHRISEGGSRVWSLDAIRFTDGTVLYLDGADYGDDQLVRATVVKPNARVADRSQNR